MSVRLKEYAKAIEGEIIAEGMDKKTLEIPVLIVKTNRGFHEEILELRYEDGHVLIKVLTEVWVDRR